MKIISTPHSMPSPPIKDLDRSKNVTKITVNDSDTLEKLELSRSGNDLSSLKSVDKFHKISENEQNKILENANKSRAALDDLYHDRSRSLEMAKTNFIENREITPPRLLSTRKNDSIEFDRKGINWVHQVSKTTIPKGTGVAAEGVRFALNMATPQQCETNDVNFEMNRIKRSAFSEAKRLVDQLGA